MAGPVGGRWWTAAVRVMAITGALAGLASVLLSQTFFVSPNSGLQPLIKGLIIALVGGLGSITGAVIAAFFIGLIEALTATYLGGQYMPFTGNLDWQPADIRSNVLGLYTDSRELALITSLKTFIEGRIVI